jgi:beta-phosphoglucomutase-like phosphatase (HAD superfamily)
MKFQAVIFDIDGVMVDSPHERAWRDTLQELMATEWHQLQPQTTYAPEHFTTAVYQEFVAGKPRMSGAQAALEHFGIPDAAQRAIIYADQKQRMIIKLIEAGEFMAFADALRFLLAVKGSGLRVAAASSSKNAHLFLRQIRLDTFAQEQGLSYPFVTPNLTLLNIFDADVTGRDFAQGKPHPEIFLTAAAELGVEPTTCVVVEDASSGVQAAKAGQMAAVGVARLGDEALLEAAGADIVVTSMDDVSLEALRAGRLERRAVTKPHDDTVKAADLETES